MIFVNMKVIFLGGRWSTENDVREMSTIFM